MSTTHDARREEGERLLNAFLAAREGLVRQFDAAATSAADCHRRREAYLAAYRLLAAHALDFGDIVTGDYIVTCLNGETRIHYRPHLGGAS